MSPIIINLRSTLLYSFSLYLMLVGYSAKAETAAKTLTQAQLKQS